MKKKALSLQRAAHWSDCGPLRFVILSRLSDDEQAQGPDTSLDAQERLCRAAVGRYISQHGGQLVTCIRGDKTGTTLKRSDWREALALAEKRAYDEVELKQQMEESEMERRHAKELEALRGKHNETRRKIMLGHLAKTSKM